MLRPGIKDLTFTNVPDPQVQYNLRFRAKAESRLPLQETDKTSDKQQSTETKAAAMNSSTASRQRAVFARPVWRA